MNYDQLATTILKAIGGEDNISGFTHCATRLRFTLKDESIVDETTLKNTNGVLGIAKNGGQYQLIIGNEVANVFKAIQSLIKNDFSNDDSSKTKRKFSEKLFDFISALFTPVLPAIIGAGLMKSLLAVAVLIGINTKGSTYYFLNLISDAPLYFLPVMLAFTGAKKLGCHQFIAVSIAGAMLHPSYNALITDAYTLNFSSFLNLPVTLATYSSSVIPVLLMLFALKYVEAFLEKYLPKMIKFFFKPLLCMLIVAPLTFIVLGPLGFIIGVGISNGLNALQQYAGWLVPTLTGAFFPLMITAGMHYGLVPFMMQSISASGYETIAGPGNLPSNIAQGAASLAIAFKTKKKELKQTAFTTGTTAILGITEPALFAVTLKFKKVLWCVMIGGGAGGFYAGIMSTKCYSFCSPGLLSLAAYVGPNGWGNLINSCISMVIAFIVTFILVMVWGYQDDEENTENLTPVKDNEKTPVNKEIIYAPASGNVVSLSEVPDPTFAGEMLGKGAAINLDNNNIYAPVSGTVTMLFPTCHAIGIKSENGAEILIHIGLDTVQLNGKYFTAHVKPEQKIQKGDLLISCEIDKINQAGYNTITPVIITNTADYSKIELLNEGLLKAGENLLELQ
ncbi:beta-glucoside-specific PTS transporter subunit IIABC [Thomasclavelia sp.]|uniref:beta-glucoside-specific PTS transporter subunit IIABC n=1 Tax=Thomasclavelia sp. TaxID=3025757 RepID=UPI0025E49252|nr:beta-glucoside-specific PTS transporter subunit IIABC [Thomasclavelia sp.]